MSDPEEITPEAFVALPPARQAELWGKLGAADQARIVAVRMARLALTPEAPARLPDYAERPVALAALPGPAPVPPVPGTAIACGWVAGLMLGAGIVGGVIIALEVGWAWGLGWMAGGLAQAIVVHATGEAVRHSAAAAWHAARR